MSPRRPTSDPLLLAKTLVDEAERSGRPWRSLLIANAWVRLDDARAGLLDSEAALQGYESPVVEMMRASVENRREEIERIAKRLEALDPTRREGS